MMTTSKLSLNLLIPQLSLLNDLLTSVTTVTIPSNYIFYGHKIAITNESNNKHSTIGQQQ